MERKGVSERKRDIERVWQRQTELEKKQRHWERDRKKGKGEIRKVNSWQCFESSYVEQNIFLNIEYIFHENNIDVISNAISGNNIDIHELTNY